MKNNNEELLMSRDLSHAPVTPWHAFSALMLVLVAVWQAITCVGWFTGDTLLNFYGLDPHFAQACVISPELLLYVPYFCVAVNIASILYIVYVLYGFLAEGLMPPILVTIGYGTAGVAALAFPLGHIVADMFVFATSIRGTMSFDFGDLNVNITNMLVIVVVSVLLLFLNLKWCDLQGIEE